MTAGWGVRATRSAVFAAVCVVLAALGHVMMSGDHVPLPTLASGWVLTGLAGWCLAGRERGLRLVVAVAVSVQTALHSAFSLTSRTPGTPALSTAAGGPVGHDMGAPMEHLGHTGHASAGDTSLGMLAAHLLAALLCGLWLGHGERAAFRLLRAVGSRLAAPLRLLFALPAPPPPAVRVRRPASDRAPRLLLLVHAVTSRGPPPGTAAA
ncbi:hypothetical protein ABZY20_08425 [Streptomyces sp. NPDC006624]|uniref:hypothetical protein n=1 Tax=Streptomyces sp. NPDC006624 TaxID=3154892 RepID=UPI0033B60C39